jgi:hypothetical protein
MAKKADFYSRQFNDKSAPEASEHNGEIEWEETNETELKQSFFASDELDLNGPHEYTLLNQFMDAAKGQPGVAFGFQAATKPPAYMVAPVILKFEDGKFYLGQNTAEDSFAGVDGNDGDADEDDLAIYPVGMGEAKAKNKRKNVTAIVESLLKELTEDDADSIAYSLLNEKSLTEESCAMCHGPITHNLGIDLCTKCLAKTKKK